MTQVIFCCKKCGVIGLKSKRQTNLRYCHSCRKLVTNEINNRCAVRYIEKVGQLTVDEIMQCYLEHPGTYHKFLDYDKERATHLWINFRAKKAEASTHRL